MTDLLSSIDPKKAQGREVTVAKVLDRAAEDLEEGQVLLDEPQVEATVRLTVADTYRELGKTGKAISHAQRALALRRAELGDSDTETLEAMASVGILTYNQGRYAEAETILQRLLALRSEEVGEEHPDTLAAMSHLANVYWAQERYEELESMDRKTLAIRRRVLGEEHPDTLRSLNGLAVTLFSTGRYAEAAEMFREALTTQRRLLGPNHPDTMQLGNNLAASLTELGRYRESEPILREVLQARLTVLGEEHDNTAMSMHNLALSLARQSKLEEAVAHMERAVAIRQRGAQGDRVRFLQSKSHLADIYRDLERLEEAEALYHDVLDELRSSKGPETPTPSRPKAVSPSYACTKVRSPQPRRSSFERWRLKHGPWAPTPSMRSRARRSSPVCAWPRDVSPKPRAWARRSSTPPGRT